MNSGDYNAARDEPRATKICHVRKSGQWGGREAALDLIFYRVRVSNKWTGSWKESWNGGCRNRILEYSQGIEN